MKVVQSCPTLCNPMGYKVLTQVFNNGWMSKEVMADKCNGISFSLENNYPAICNNMDEPGGQYGSLDSKRYLLLVKNFKQKIF